MKDSQCPYQKDPKIKLLSFKIFPFHPPFTLHHLQGIANEHIPITKDEAKREAGK